MKIIYYSWVALQAVISLNLFLPILTYLLSLRNKRRSSNFLGVKERDFAVIVTAYEQVDLLPFVIDSILKLKYNNYVVYVVADKCDISALRFNSERVVLLRPEITLANNVKSHFYAIDRFVRPHDCLTIIDSDNIVDPFYLEEINNIFSFGFEAVQGQRKAKNLNTTFACLDEAGDIYYRYIDRKLLFEAGSSSSLAGSGMAFTTALYIECLERSELQGAGFDKVLQMELLSRGKRIAFAENAIVYDEKSSKSDQLVKQRSRWINTWFKYAGRGVSLAITGLERFNLNQILNGIAFSRPPLFMLVLLTVFSVVLDYFFLPQMIYFWLIAIVGFFVIFIMSLLYFKAPKKVILALIRIPVFVFYQLVALFKSKNANKISTATVHYYDK